MILVDTHVLIWAAVDRQRLSRLARAKLSDEQLCLSAASAWEIATKYRLGKLPEAERLLPNFRETLRALGYTLLSVTFEHSILAGSFTMPHKDPFDRLIAAQAKIENIPLLSNDVAFDQFPIQRIW